MNEKTNSKTIGASALGLLFLLLSVAFLAYQNRMPIRTIVIVETVSVVEVILGGDWDNIVTATPKPPPPLNPGPKTLIVCLGIEPESLYLYGTPSLAQRNVLEAIYDGPFDTNSYGYQPVILEKIPSLADGDAVLQPVIIREGDLVVDNEGNPVILTGGITIRPTGCQATDCAITFESGEIEMDQLSVNFTLLAELKWSDGEPLTANDSVYSYELDADPATPTSKYRIERTASYTTLDDRTVQWVGLPGFLDQTYQTNFWSPLPEHAWKTIAPDKLLYAERSSRRPIGWGPYIIESWEKGVEIRLTKNPSYFRAAEEISSVEHLIFRFVGNTTNANIAKILSGECDLVDSTARLDDQTELIQELAASSQLTLHHSHTPIWEHADFGLLSVAYDDGYQAGIDRPDFFADVRTRRAIAYCIDRQQIVDMFYFGLYEVADNYLASSHPLFNASIPKNSFNPEAGRTLLAEVGWYKADRHAEFPRVAKGIPNVPDGTSFAFTYHTTTGTYRQKAAQLIAEDLARCGIEVTLKFDDPDTFFADGPQGPVFGRDFDMVQFAWGSGVIPPCNLFLSDQIPGFVEGGWFNGDNVIGYTSLAFDEACRRALSLLHGQPGYVEANYLAQQIFAKDLPVIPLYFRTQIAISRPDFRGQVMDPTAKSDFWDLEHFDYGYGCGCGR